MVYEGYPEDLPGVSCFGEMYSDALILEDVHEMSFRFGYAEGEPHQASDTLLLPGVPATACTVSCPACSRHLIERLSNLLLIVDFSYGVAFSVEPLESDALPTVGLDKCRPDSKALQDTGQL